MFIVLRVLILCPILDALNHQFSMGGDVSWTPTLPWSQITRRWRKALATAAMVAPAAVLIWDLEELPSWDDPMWVCLKIGYIPNEVAI